MRSISYMAHTNNKSRVPKKNGSFISKIKRDRNLYLLILPGIMFFVIFYYVPYYYLQIAFKEYDIISGITSSEWVGLKYFKSFFNDAFAFRTIRNTLLISIYSLVFGFPIPIIFALLLNNIRNSLYKKVAQTVSYLPHFISSAVVVGLVINLLSPSTGIINQMLVNVFHIEPIYFLTKPEFFRTIYVSMGIWREFGWNAVIYLAALSTIDICLYEAAIIDGAGKWKQMIYVTLPGIKNVIVITFILSLGSILSVGFETIILLYNPMVYETADVISTYVYRRGMGVAGAGMPGGIPDYSYATAIGLFQSVVGFVLVMISNKLAKRFSDVSLY